MSQTLGQTAWVGKILLRPAVLQEDTGEAWRGSVCRFSSLIGSRLTPLG